MLKALTLTSRILHVATLHLRSFGALIQDLLVDSRETEGFYIVYKANMNMLLPNELSKTIVYTTNITVDASCVVEHNSIEFKWCKYGNKRIE